MYRQLRASPPVEQPDCAEWSPQLPDHRRRGTERQDQGQQLQLSRKDVLRHGHRPEEVRRLNRINPDIWLIQFRDRIEVIADDEDEIVEAARRMTEKYDMVITSGGIGPTHDVSLKSIHSAFF